LMHGVVLQNRVVGRPADAALTKGPALVYQATRSAKKESAP
jgi:hypothetical protein